MTVEQWLLPKLPVILCGEHKDRSKAELDGLAWTIAKSMGLLDYHIIPNANAVVTQEALEAFARAMVAAASGLDETDEEWDETMEGMWNESYAEAVARFKERAPAVLESLNITVVNEVVEVEGMFETGTEFDEHVPTVLRRGDILYIKKAKTK